jgi:hypothetical protein
MLVLVNKILRSASVQVGLLTGPGKQIFLLGGLPAQPKCIDLDVVLFGVIDTLGKVPAQRFADKGTVLSQNAGVAQQHSKNYQVLCFEQHNIIPASVQTNIQL